MTKQRVELRILFAAVASAWLFGCEPRRAGQTHDLGPVQTGAPLQLWRATYGRLVDVYAYRRIDPSIADRRLRANRRLERIATDVVVDPRIASQALFDAAGQESPTANYEFLAFDKTVGHERLVILWDDRPGPEAQRFDGALAAAQVGLTGLPAAFRNQDTELRPIPIVPRNAAVRLEFSGPVGVDAAFFAANPAALQLLEIVGDPAVVGPANAFRVLPVRAIPNGNAIVLDTTILGGEAHGGPTSPGLPPSLDSVTANIRIAIPTDGGVAGRFIVGPDPAPSSNDVDSAGRPAAIRDLRSGNAADGAAGRLGEPDAPRIVATLPMGIVAVDPVADVITLNKRLRTVPVRGRYPFVDGPLAAGGVPAGPQAVPTERPLSSGDILIQDVTVLLGNGTFETVRLEAEVLRNLEIVSTAGAPDVGLAASPPTGDSGQGELLPVVRVEVATVSPGRDSDGNPVSFVAGPPPVGEDCELRATYVERVPLIATAAAIGDRAWRSEFVRIDPPPAAPTAGVDPMASVAIEFTKPLDLEQVDTTKTLLLTNTPIAAEPFALQLGDPKRATARVVPTRLVDADGDSALLRLVPPLGLAHQSGTSEPYAVHARLGTNGLTDLGGNALEVFDDPAAPLDAWSFDFAVAAAASANRVAWHVWRFEAEDEDGTPPGSADLFGQYRLQDGRLVAAEAVRFGRSANYQNLSTVSRITRGECWDDGTAGTASPNQLILPVANPPAGWVPVDPATGAPHPGLLYWSPRMIDSIAPPSVPSVFPNWQTMPQPVGRVIEPLKVEGSRLQMRYIEDDFSLGYADPQHFALDVEQLYWSPFGDEPVQYDVFDRFTLSLGHADKRPDERWLLYYDAMTPPVPWCVMDCASMNSGLSTVFADNVLQGTSLTPVFEDRVYTIDPRSVFRDRDNVPYVPFPRFDRTYTWRDSRLVTVDAGGQVLGLGGALQPDAFPPTTDTTANIDSPWISGNPPPAFLAAGGSVWTQDLGDFIGFSRRDHDPIALPLLVDFKVFPDGPANGFAAGLNGNQVAMLGPPSAGFPFAPGGYYDRVPSGCGFRNAWPKLRVQATGGADLITGAAILIDPDSQRTAQTSNLLDAGLGAPTTGLFTAPPGDGMLHWSRADFVRRVATATFGFFDTLRPQRSVANGMPTAGFPDWLAIDPTLRARDLLVQLDPPLAAQPGGTSVVVELRGAADFGNAGVLYDPSSDDGFDTRGNLLNPNYACEAYRYSSANVFGTARVPAVGLTRYAEADQLGLIADPTTGLLPRYLNPRVVMTNNVDVTPTLSPSLRSMSVVYRLSP